MCRELDRICCRRFSPRFCFVPPCGASGGVEEAPGAAAVVAATGEDEPSAAAARRTRDEGAASDRGERARPPATLRSGHDPRK